MRPTILLVDDEKIIQLFLDKTLGKKFDLTIKENGAEGLKWLQEGNYPNLIVSDLYMPEMDGFEFIRQIRSLKEAAHIPVIMLSGMESPEEKKQCLELGADAYLTKPLNIVQLTDIIEKLLGR